MKMLTSKSLCQQELQARDKYCYSSSLDPPLALLLAPSPHAGIWSTWLTYYYPCWHLANLLAPQPPAGTWTICQ